MVENNAKVWALSMTTRNQIQFRLTYRCIIFARTRNSQSFSFACFWQNVLNFIFCLYLIDSVDCMGAGQLPAPHTGPSPAPLLSRPSVCQRRKVERLAGQRRGQRLRSQFTRLQVRVALRAAAVAIGGLFLYAGDRQRRMPVETRLPCQSPAGRLPAAVQPVPTPLWAEQQTRSQQADQSAALPSGPQEILHLRLGRQERRSIRVGRAVRRRVRHVPNARQPPHPHGHDPLLAEIIQTLRHPTAGRVILFLILIYFPYFS